ncbi:MAG: tetratricopeptide repeat protein, partial [Terracidiphilus sp.]
VVHDRYFYVPSIGAAMLVALLLEQVARGAKQRVVLGQPLRVIALGFGLAILLAVVTMKESYYWQDDYTLFDRAFQIAPHNPGAVNNLSVEWMSRGDLLPAEQALEQGLRENPQDSRFPANLGRAFYQQKQYAKAEEFARHAIALDPNAAEAYLTLAEIQLKQNDAAQAQSSMRRAVELNRVGAPYHTIYGIVLEVNGNCPQALVEFRTAQSLVPGDFFNEREIARCSALAAPAAPAVATVPKSVAH